MLPHQDRVQSQKEKIRKPAFLYSQPSRKRLMAREVGNRASRLEGVMKPPLFFEFPSDAPANIDSNHMLLEHYISQFTSGKVMLFHHDIVPFCANAREDKPRRSTAGQEFSVGAPERKTVRVLHRNFLPYRLSQKHADFSWLKKPFGLCLRSGLRDWVWSESKGPLQQVGGYRKSVLLGDRLLDRARIIAIDVVVNHLIEKRR
jgi:hypothetical protein